ncbi:MAG TPA: hypothetical protein VLC09_17540 [Polyangiaceae bacterium]|nr:hypothetical protein [Polyangiaceae bacterium]
MAALSRLLTRPAASFLFLALVGSSWLAVACGGDDGDMDGDAPDTGDSDGDVGGANGSGGNGSGGSNAGPNAWRNVHIGGGGYVTGIVYHPSAADVFYARTDMGGLYRYDADAGAWIQLLDWIGRGHSHHYGILSVAVDPNDADKVYAMAGTNTDPSWAGAGALLRSDDRGATWEQVDLSGAAIAGGGTLYVGGNEEGRGSGERLAVDPNLGTTLFMGTTKAGLWKSSDGGSTWSQVTGTGLTATTNVLFVHLDASSSSAGNATQRILVSTSAGVVASVDGGASWALVANQPASEMALRASQSGSTVYLTYGSNAGPNNSSSAGGGVFQLALGNLALTDVTPSAWGAAFGGVSVDAADPQHALVATLFNWNAEEIYETKNGGDTWTPLGVEAAIDASAYPHVDGSHIHWITDVKLDPHTAGEFSFVTGQGFYRCQGLGGTLGCSFDDAGLEEMVPLQLVSPPEGPELLSVMGDRDGFVHDDLTVSPPRFSPNKGTTRSLAIGWQQPNILAKTFDTAPFGALSSDGGKTWSDFATYPANTVACVDYFCGLRNIAVSADGATLVWSPVSAAPSRSTNNGGTWTASTGISATLPKLPPKPVADRVNPQAFYALDVMSGVVYRSSDAGVSFTAGSTVLPHATADWYASNFELASVPDNEGHLWAAVADGNSSGSAGGAGLYRSTDGGASFTPVAAAAITGAFRVGFGAPMASSPYPAIFVVGIVDGVDGIFRSTDEGATWTRVNDDQHRFGLIHQVTGDPKVPGRVYVAAEGRGILYATQE